MARNRKSRRQVADESMVAMEVYDHLLNLVEDNGYDPTQQMHVLQVVNFVFITELFAKSSWQTAFDRMANDIRPQFEEFPG